MVLSHVFEYTGVDDTVGIAYRIMFIGSHQFAAPVFMLAMGLGLVYTRHGDADSVMRRGLRVFTAGIILNVVRCVPSLAGYLATENPEMLELALEDLVIVDIFQLTGLSLMLMGLFKKIKTPYWCMLLRRCTNTNKLFLIITPITVAIYLSYKLYAAPLGIGMFDTETSLHFYQICTFDAFISLCAALATIGVGHFLMNICSEKVQNETSRIAADLMRIYVVSWILITWILSLLLEELLGMEFTVATTVIAGVCILLASILLVRVKPFSDMKV